MPVNTPHPGKVLAQDVQTGVALNCNAAAPAAGLLQYITKILLKMTQLAAQAAAGFDVTITGIEGGTVTIPLINPGVVGDGGTVSIDFVSPMRAAGAVAVVGTPTANTRLSASIYGFQAP